MYIYVHTYMYISISGFFKKQTVKYVEEGEEGEEEGPSVEESSRFEANASWSF